MSDQVPVPLLQPRQMCGVLNRQGVRYVLIGGLAAALHGSPIRTDDADICPSADRANLDALAAALRQMRARVWAPDVPKGLPFPWDASSLAQVTVWNLVTDLGDLDISFRPDGTQGYDDLSARAITFDIGEGVTAPVAALIDIIRSKEAANRPKDHQSLPILREILARTRSG